MSNKIEYPKWLYHPEEQPRVVQSREEHEALDARWVEHPDEVESEQEQVAALADMTDEQLVAYAEDDKRGLEAQAKEELGIDLDLRYAPRALAAMVRKAIDEQEQPEDGE